VLLYKPDICEWGILPDGFKVKESSHVAAVFSLDDIILLSELMVLILENDLSRVLKFKFNNIFSNLTSILGGVGNQESEVVNLSLRIAQAICK
jgi:hypothetical protein